MTITDILTTLGTHMVEGLMYHEQLTQAFLFLGLRGFSKCQEYRHLDETRNYLDICNYMCNQYSTLLFPRKVTPPEILPEKWRTYIRENVSAGERREAVSKCFAIWVEWEASTKKLYEEAYKDALDLGEIEGARYICLLIKDVADELEYATSEELKWSSMDFDMVSILEAQNDYEKKFRKKLKRLYE